ncbi:ABC transporter permease [Kovacikia minuta CCNUW1]|uniref:ABC transporter permease n=1 Tax=Kovacikia minuta TaxID=2931930 RepID=UPI001CCC3216|nr:ABC transporter permease [Kovacikia minuta]UBF24082.1 ABC transporter permease [Kovacikia minuta CCNUW1]
MKRILAQCVKELVQFRRDRLTLALAFLLPLLTLFIFGFAIRLESKNIPLVVQDFDRSKLSNTYIERLFATNQFQPVRWSGNDPARDALDQGIAKAVVIIPPDFSRRIKSSKATTVQVLVDGTDANNARVIRNSIQATTNFFLQSAGLQQNNQNNNQNQSDTDSATNQILNRNSQNSPASDNSNFANRFSDPQSQPNPTGAALNRINPNQSSQTVTHSGDVQIQPVAGNTGLVGTVTAHVRLWFNPGRKESLYIVPGVYAVVLWIFPSLLSAIAMVREKEKGTILQVYASSLTATELLLGKALAYIIVGLCIALIVIGLGSLIFQVELAGDPTPLLLGIPIYLSASVMFGLLIGVRSSNQNSAVQAVSLVGFLTAFLLSGFIYPLSNIPFHLSLVPNIIPARYFIIVTRDAFVRGIGWAGVWFDILMIIVLALLCFNVARRVLSRMQLPD